jgi:hypothetical protein
MSGEPLLTMTTVMTMTREQSWRDDGHVSDLALTLAVDGEDALLGADARDHLASCEACSARLGEAAELAAVAAMALEHVAADSAAQATALSLAPVSSGRRFAFPKRAMLAAVVLAGLCSAPAAVGMARSLPSLLAMSAGGVPFAFHTGLRVLRRVLEHAAPVLAFAPFAAALVLVLVGIVLVRLLPARRGDVA